MTPLSQQFFPACLDNVEYGAGNILCTGAGCDECTGVVGCCRAKVGCLGFKHSHKCFFCTFSLWLDPIFQLLS